MPSRRARRIEDATTQGRDVRKTEAAEPVPSDENAPAEAGFLHGLTRAPEAGSRADRESETERELRETVESREKGRAAEES